MIDDSFQRFERSRGGLLIPLLLLVLGAVPTTLAITTMNEISMLQDARQSPPENDEVVTQEQADSGQSE